MEVKQAAKQYRPSHPLVYGCHYHVIFYPKHRREVLTHGIAIRLRELIVEKQEEYGYQVLEMEIMSDHVHLLLDANPQIGMVKMVGKIKGYTAHTLREEFPALKSRLRGLWTRSKHVSSVGAVTLEVVRKTIEEQEGV